MSLHFSSTRHNAIVRSGPSATALAFPDLLVQGAAQSVSGRFVYTASTPSSVVVGCSVGVATSRRLVLARLQHSREVRSMSKARKLIGSELKSKAGWVHQRLTDAAALGSPMSEETITESVLLDLQLALGVHLEVGTFTRWQESRVTGADWQWWFCDGLGDRMFGMRVQAKKLKLTKAGVPYYDFAYKPRFSKVRQVDRLIARATQDRLPAVYALYNGPELDLNSFTWTCCTEPQSAQTFGVSMISADSARRLADQKDTTLAASGGLAKPWSCSALCPTWLRQEASVLWPPPGDGSLSLYAADLVTDLLARDHDRLGVSERQRLLDAAVGFRTFSEAPAYVRELAEMAAGQDTLDRPPPQLEDGPRGVGHVALFMELPG